MVIFKNQLILIAGLVLSIWAYSPGLDGKYQFDDYHNIVRNAQIKIESISSESLWSAAWSSNSGPLKRPVSMLSFALNHYFSGVDPWWMKTTNLVIHLFNAILLFLILKSIFNYTTHLSANFKSVAPFLISAIWIVHPINITSVTYIVQRMTSLASFFVLVSIYFYIKLRQSNPAWLKSLFTGILVLFFWGMGLFTKEQAAILSFYIFIIEIYFYKFKTESLSERNILYSLHFILLAPWVIAILYIFLNPEFITDGYVSRNFTLLERVLSESRVMVEYIRLIVIPDITKIGIYHDDIVVSKSLFKPITTLFSYITLIAMFIFGVTFRKRYPLASFGIMWFFAGHILESSIFGLELMFLHRNYLPSIGILLVLVEFVGLVYTDRSKTLLTVSFVIIVVLSVCTRFLTYQWSDDQRMQLIEAMNNPESPRANFRAGQLLKAYAITSLTAEAEQEYRSKAITYFGKIRQVNPESALGDVAVFQMQLQLDEKPAKELTTSLIQSLSTTEISVALVNSIRAISNCIIDEACPAENDDYELMMDALIENPKLQGSSRGRILNYYSSYHWIYLREYREAILLMNQSIEVDPTNMHSHRLFISYLNAVKHYDAMSLAIDNMEKNDIFILNKEYIESMKSALNNSID